MNKLGSINMEYNNKMVCVLIMALICLLTIDGILYGQINEKNLIIEKQNEIHNNRIIKIESELINIEYILDKKQEEYNEYYDIKKQYSDIADDSIYYVNKSNEYIMLFNDLNENDFGFIENDITQTGEYRDFLKNEYNPFIKESNEFTEEYNLYLDTYDLNYATVNNMEKEHNQKWFNYWNNENYWNSATNVSLK